jgi:hypothetical protein
MSKSKVYKSPQAIDSAIRKMRSEALFGLHQDGFSEEKAQIIEANLERLRAFLLAELEKTQTTTLPSQDEPYTKEEQVWLGEDNVPKKPVGGWSW